MNSNPHIYSARLLNCVSLCVLFTILLSVSFGNVVNAQSITLLEESRGLYLGVKPGQNKYAPGKKVKKSDQMYQITWIGFQAMKDRGKVFVQGNRSLLYEVASSNAKQVILDFPNTKLQTRNDSRSLDTRYFPTAVLSIQAKQVLQSLVRVTIQLREKVKYQIKKDQKFLYLVFDPPRYPVDLQVEVNKQRHDAESRETTAVYGE